MSLAHKPILLGVILYSIFLFPHTSSGQSMQRFLFILHQAQQEYENSSPEVKENCKEVVVKGTEIAKDTVEYIGANICMGLNWAKSKYNTYKHGSVEQTKKLYGPYKRISRGPCNHCNNGLYTDYKNNSITIPCPFCRPKSCEYCKDGYNYDFKKKTFSIPCVHCSDCR